jgi:hypothetical protein
MQLAKTSEDWLKENGKYIPYPATWLKGCRWEDEVLNEGSANSESPIEAYKKREGLI